MLLVPFLPTNTNPTVRGCVIVFGDFGVLDGGVADWTRVNNTNPAEMAGDTYI